MQEELQELKDTIDKNLKKGEKIKEIAVYNNMKLLPKEQTPIELEEKMIVIVTKQKKLKTKIQEYGEVYNKKGMKVAEIQKGELKFTHEYIEQIQQLCKNGEEIILNLSERVIDIEILLKQNEQNKVNLEEQEKNENLQNKKQQNYKEIKEQKALKQEDEKPKTKSKTKTIEQIAKEKQIPNSNIVSVRENSNLYKDYPNLRKEEPNLYFYKDNNGTIRAEYIDKETQKDRKSVV